MFRDQDEGRVFTMHRGPEKPGSVGGIARDGDVDPGVVGEGSLVCLTVPKAAARQISSIRRVDNKRASPRAKRAPAQITEIGHELIPSRPDEVDELQLEDRPLAIRSEPTGDTDNGRLRQRRIENLLREFGRELLCEAE